MTRYNKKSVALSALVALIVLMAIGANSVFGDNTTHDLVHEFGELLEGVETEILSIPTGTESAADTTQILQTDMILSQIAYIDAFDETQQIQSLRRY